jgi:glycosyltransferase involved in cell wall biosynthesis
MPQKNSLRIQLLSIVVPAYKQEKTIAKDIKKIQESLNALGYKYEIIVVLDGTNGKIRKNWLPEKSREIKILSYEKNQGKGHAVRFGMQHAKGNIIGFIDAGMDIHPSGLLMLLNHMEWYNADIIVGSKLHPVSKIHNYPLWRKILSRGYRLLTATLFGFKINDTQVGIKFFKKKVIKDVLSRLLVKNYAFDVEILAVAHHLGYIRIFEAPVKINFKTKQSTITSKNFWKIIASMLWDTLAVYYRLRILKYYDQEKSLRQNKNLNPKFNFNK